MTDSAAFEQLLNQQLALVSQLESLLLNEKEILQQQNPDALSNIIAQKQELLASIENLDSQIKQSRDYPTFSQLPAAKTAIENIEASFVKCKELNDVNGQIIQQSNLAIERMQNALLETRNKSSMTYDNKGKTSGGTLSKGIKA